MDRSGLPIDAALPRYQLWLVYSPLFARWFITYPFGLQFAHGIWIHCDLVYTPSPVCFDSWTAASRLQCHYLQRYVADLTLVGPGDPATTVGSL